MPDNGLPVRFDHPEFNQNEQHNDECFAETVYGDRNIGLHWHNFYEMDFFLSGNAVQIMNGIKSNVSPGSLTLLSDTDFHEYIISEGSRPTIVTVRFLEQKLDREATNRLLLLSGKQYDCTDPVLYNALSSDFRQLSTEAGIGGVNHIELMFKYIETVLLLIGRMELNPSFGKTDSSVLLYPEIRYIEKNFRRDITLNEVANVAGFSPTYFSKVFFKRYKSTFKNYLLERRLVLAYRLICSSELPVSGICFESGFGNHANFCRSFRKRYGLSPTELRKNLGK